MAHVARVPHSEQNYSNLKVHWVECIYPDAIVNSRMRLIRWLSDKGKCYLRYQIFKRSRQNIRIWHLLDPIAWSTAFDMVRLLFQLTPHCKSKLPEFVSTTTLKRFNLCKVALCCRRLADSGEWSCMQAVPTCNDSQCIKRVLFFKWEQKKW